MSDASAVVGVIGGSGLYEIDGLVGVRETALSTPFGEPSDAFVQGELDGVPMVFLPRHGRGHRISPTEINSRANLWGMKRLGVTHIISVSAVGSMREDIHPGDFVIIDQFIDRTRHRPDTFFEGGCVAHVGFADPVSPEVRRALLEAAGEIDVRVHDGGTYVNMEGPQFSTRAESRLYRTWDVDVIGMTNLQEARLAREAEICYATVAMATDYDCWHEAHDAVTVEAVIEIMQSNVGHARELIRAAVPRIAAAPACGCSDALRHAIMTAPDRHLAAGARASRAVHRQVSARRLSVGPGGSSDMRPHPSTSLVVPLLAVALVTAACSSGRHAIPYDQLGAGSGVQVVEASHRGPLVAGGQTGTRRFAPELYEAFDEERAMKTVRVLDRWYRTPANDGYEASLEHLEAELRAAGFGSDPRLLLEVFETRVTATNLQGRRVPVPAWTPLSARVTLTVAGRRDRDLHRFDSPEDMDRTMLPVNAPAGSAEGPVVFHLDQIESGSIFVTEAEPRRSVLNRAVQAGAAAVVSSSLYPFNTDPSGAERHLDAVQYRKAPYDLSIPLVMISPRSYETIRSEAERMRGARLAVLAQVRWDERPLRTLSATVVGSDRPEEAVVAASHVQEPGACDNATGVAGLLESAVAYAELLREGRLDWPSRSVAFVWGDEFRQTTTWIDQSGRTAVAGVSSDMTGQSTERTGAIALLERMPDPGAIVTLPPDEHTPWGARPVDAEELQPNGLAVIARSAMADVNELSGGDWTTAEHPWEGGSDHDEFIERGIPAVLFWHFTDYAYHTSLDRLDNVDAREMRRTAAALLATVLAVADPRPTDLERYLHTLDREQALRVAAAEEAEDAELAEHWRTWCYGARLWLRVECLRIPTENR